MKVIIAGSRRMMKFDVVATAADLWVDVFGEPAVVLTGGAWGVDQLAEGWAKRRGITVDSRPADWRRHGKAAGPIRNQEMVDEADGLVAVWDGESRGTADVIDRAKRRGLPTLTFLYQLSHFQWSNLALSSNAAVPRPAGLPD